MNGNEAIALIAEFLEQSPSPEMLAAFEGRLTGPRALPRLSRDLSDDGIAHRSREGLEMPDETKIRPRNLFLAALGQGGKLA